MKNFLYDLVATQSNADGAFHGGGKYAKKVFFELLLSPLSANWNVLAVYDATKDLDIEVRKCSDKYNVKLIDIAETNLTDLVEKYDICRFYTAQSFGLTDYGFDKILGAKCEVYVTIHGLRSLETGYSLEMLPYATSLKEKAVTVAKWSLERKLLLRDSTRYSSLITGAKIVTVSNHTKYSLMSFFPDLVSDVKVFYSPNVTAFEDLSMDQSAINFNQSNYFLMVSGNRWLKNNIRSAKALDELFTERPDIKQNVIITGVSNPEVYQKALKNKHRFSFYKYVGEGFLQVLYKNAYAFLYMTLNEGFGYPPLEAMKFGLPVVTSPFTSLTEICDNAVLYANPYSVKEIKSRVLWLIGDIDKHKELIENSLRQFESISKRQERDTLMLTSYLLK